MNRATFLKLARKHGYRDGTEPRARGERKPLAGSSLEALRRELREYFETPAGQEAISRAPSWLREKPVDEIIKLLLSEVK